jgi:hypothetical protein
MNFPCAGCRQRGYQFSGDYCNGNSIRFQGMNTLYAESQENSSVQVLA